MLAVERIPRLIILEWWKNTQLLACYDSLLCSYREISQKSTCYYDHKNYQYQCLHHQLHHVLRFVQRYKIRSEGLLPLEKLDSLPNCFRLSEHRTQGEINSLSATKEFGLVPLKSIRADVTVLSKDKRMNFLGQRLPAKSPIVITILREWLVEKSAALRHLFLGPIAISSHSGLTSKRFRMNYTYGRTFGQIKNYQTKLFPIPL